MNTQLNHSLHNLYSIDAILFEPVTKGMLSTNFIVHTDNKKYFLKCYRFNSESKIKEIHSIKQFFNKGGISVIMPIPTNTGKTYFDLESKFYTLFPFIAGHNYEHYGNTLPNEQTIVSLGKMCAKIHLCGRKSTLSVSKQFKAWDTNVSLENIRKILEIIAEIKDKNELDKKAQEGLLLKKKLLEQNTITFDSLGFKNDHLIHGDYLDHNVFFNDNDEVIAVFDFEKADKSPREYELFRSMILTFIYGIDSEHELRNSKVYLDAYRSIYPLSEDQIKRGFELLYQKQIHGTWVETEHYLNNNFRVDIFFDVEFGRLKYLAQNKEVIIKTITYS